MTLIPTQAEVDRISSAEDARYLKNKITGGGSGRNGVVFELRFIAYRIAQEAIRAKKANADPTTIKFGVQVRSFIDDFVVHNTDGIYWYEIKSGAVVEWNSGPHTIAENFLSQMLLDMGRKITATYSLVVPTSQHEKELDDTRDFKSKEMKVVVFPNSSNVNDIERHYAWFPDSLSKLIPLDATRRDYEDFFMGLQAIALNLPNNEMLDLAYVSGKLSTKYDGAFTCAGDEKLDSRTEEIILAVPGMSVVVCGDQVHFKCTKPKVRGQVSGCHIGRQSGDDFEEMIRLREPMTWGELSPILWGEYGGF
ncbi:hypothetical protein [Agrobacterium sp. El2ro-1b]|uniref:hypothetical protein n=1 Tax=Agrobacterium sp. El2ro-1b TaxID=2969528 RepID=UPI0013AF7B81